MNTAMVRSRPTIWVLFRSQTHTLLIHHVWELLVIGIVIWVYQFLSLRLDSETFSNIIAIGGPGFPGAFIFTCLTVFWAIRIWDDMHPGSWDAFNTYPVNRTIHQGTRIVAGLILLFLTLIGFWILGAVVSAIIYPDANWFTNTWLHGSIWIISIIGLLNAYLLGTVFAQLCRRPELWFFVGLPVGIVLLGFTASMMHFETLQMAFRFIFGGLVLGLALVGSPMTNPIWLPHIPMQLGCTLILSILIVLASRHRKVA